MYEIYFRKENKTIQAEAGETLLQVMQRSGIGSNAVCGGRGTCGKCTVRADGEKCLACQFTVEKCMTVETLEEEQGVQIAAAGRRAGSVQDPVLRIGKVCLAKPGTGDGRSEWERLLDEIKKAEKADVSGIRTDLALASELYGKRMKGDKWYAAFSEDRVLEISEEKPELYLAAFDIGTTTVAAVLLSGESHKRLAYDTCLNPQISYGADVIARMSYVQQNGMKELTGCIRKTLKAMLGRMCIQGGVKPEQVAEVVIAANTCMHHLLLGISVESLALAPYVPAVGGALFVEPGMLGLSIHPRGRIWLPGNISGYIGGDITAGLSVLRPDLEKEPMLFLDIGTNTEMVLGDEKGLLCASAASGPAFEGEGITCGMRGAEGAVDHVYYADGKWAYTTIGGTAAKGLCGSGLIDLTACLLKAGLLDEYGILDSGGEDPQCFVLVPPEDAACSGGVFLTQKDISQLQMAKAAIAAGIRLLLEAKGLEAADLSGVELAGGFGSFIDPENAARIGLFPPELVPIVHTAGNTALEGAVYFLTSRKARRDAEGRVGKTRFIELAAMESFQDAFIDALSFEEE